MNWGYLQEEAVRSSLQEHGYVTVHPQLSSCMVGFMKRRMGFQDISPTQCGVGPPTAHRSHCSTNMAYQDHTSVVVSDHQFINTDNICEDAVM
jgi:hypothetical protein